MASGDLTVSVERVVHDTLAAVLERVFEQHGLRVDSLEVNWSDVGTFAEPRFQIAHLSIETVSFAPHKPAEAA